MSLCRTYPAGLIQLVKKQKNHCDFFRPYNPSTPPLSQPWVRGEEHGDKETKTHIVSMPAPPQGSIRSIVRERFLNVSFQDACVGMRSSHEKRLNGVMVCVHDCIWEGEARALFVRVCIATSQMVHAR